MRNLILVFAAIAATGWCQSEERRATVSFLVMDESGEMLSDWKVSNFKANDSELAPQFTGLTGTHIPTGLYRYVLTGSGTRPGWIPRLGGQVSVSVMEKFLVLTATREVRDGIWSVPCRVRLSYVGRSSRCHLPTRTPTLFEFTSTTSLVRGPISMSKSILTALFEYMNRRLVFAC